MYAAVVFLHILGVFGFLLAHGASANVALKLRSERSRESVCTLLDLSTASYNLMYGSLALLLVAGIVAGFMGNWWGRLWIWAALVSLVVVMVLMYVVATPYYTQLRIAAGMPYFAGRKMQPPESPVGDSELIGMLESGRPMAVAAIGGVGLAVILALMVFKPF